MTKRMIEAKAFLRKHFRTIDDFDYPDYGGLPRRISDKLSPDEVDALQEYLWDLKERK